MKHIYWLGVVLVVSLGVYFSTHMTVSPESISKVKFAQYSLPEEFGKVIFEELQGEIKSAPLIFLGVTPNKIEDLELWRGFLESNQKPGEKYDVIVVEAMLPSVEIFQNGLHLPVKEDMPRLAEGIKKARKQGLRVAVIAPHIYTSQLIKSNPVDRLKQEFQIQGVSLTVTKFPTTRNEESTFQPACIDSGAQDIAGTSNLGCMIRNMARKTYKNLAADKKKPEPKKYSGLMDQITQQDYLILFNKSY